MKTLRSAIAAVGSVVIGSSLVLTGCGSSDDDSTKSAAAVTQAEIDKAMSTPTTLTFWAWVPGIEDEVALFEEEYPAIKVKVVNLGGSTAQYPKLRAAVKAGKGVPDVAQVGYDFIPSFTQTNSLLDLTAYTEADGLEDEFVPGIWSQVALNGGVWGVPQDAGPMGTLYRSDIFEKAGVEAPATWDEFAETAETIKNETGAYITNFPGNDPTQTQALLAQAGATLFEYDGKETVSIDVDNATTQKVAAFWQDLIQRDLVAVDPDFTDGWYQGLSRGTYATWLTAAWGPTFLAGSAANTSGNWTAAPLPQWEAGEQVSANWGGSSNAVMAATENPIAAYMLAKFINTDSESTLMLANKQSLYPTTKATLTNPEFTDATSEFYGGQQVNKLFGEIATTVNSNQKFTPFQDYVNSSFNETVGTAIAERGDIVASLTAWQDSLIKYAEQQGFTVN